ncbi:hypothetical protein BGZ54_004151 [Gamsiella multidivaricata]|nr:hypothetical protein BGZ54_004151 [Gamsiella multidivaricata]
MKATYAHTMLFASTMQLATLISSVAAQSVKAFNDSLSNHNNFIVANGYGPERWGCSFVKTQVHQSGEGTTITIGKDSPTKPYSCGELIYRQANMSYGTYSIEMIASKTVGQVTSFFLIANGDTEIDVELTGLDTKLGWMNVWHNNQQNPVSVELPFDVSTDWHSYSFDWYKDHIVWVSYKLAINSWAQVQPEVNIDWAGKFNYPPDGEVPKAHFRNMKYIPRVYDSKGNIVSGGDDSKSNGANLGGNNKKKSNAEISKSPTGALAIAGIGMVAVAFAFTILF